MYMRQGQFVTHFPTQRYSTWPSVAYIFTHTMKGNSTEVTFCVEHGVGVAK